jgi:tetratricopeptide (TPR) repeat protein
MNNPLNKYRFIVTVFLFTLLLSLSPLLNAQDKPAPPQDLVIRVIKLYQEKDQELDVNMPDQAKTYISLFEKDLESFLCFDLNLLDKDSRKALSDVYDDYALSYLKYNNRNPSLEDRRKAEALYLKAIELDPKNSETIENLATLYYDQGDYGNAAKYFGMAFDLNSSNLGAKALRDDSIQKMNKR